MSRERPESAPPHEGRGRRRRSIVAVAAPRDTYPGPASLARLSGRIGLASFTVFLAVGVASRLGPDPLIAVLGAATALAGAVPLFLLRPRFVIAYAVVATVGVGLIENAAPGGVGWFAVVVLAAWCVLAGGVRVGLLYGTGTLLLFGAEWLWALRDPGWGPWTAGVTFTVLAMILVRHEFVLVERLRAAQADLEERSRAEERTRIARELHDVIAHGLTVSLLHLSSARLAVEHDDPADAARALAEAERVSRQSLAEVRATMGVLHADPTRGSRHPSPASASCRNSSSSSETSAPPSPWRSRAASTTSRRRPDRPSTASLRRPSPTPPGMLPGRPSPSACRPAPTGSRYPSTAPALLVMDRVSG